MMAGALHHLHDVALHLVPQRPTLILILKRSAAVAQTADPVLRQRMWTIGRLVVHSGFGFRVMASRQHSCCSARGSSPASRTLTPDKRVAALASVASGLVLALALRILVQPLKAPSRNTRRVYCCCGECVNSRLVVCQAMLMAVT